MKLSAVMAALSTVAALASAGLVIAPIEQDQVVEKMSGDCFFGVVTPQGCGCAIERRKEVMAEI
ncbi:hypothetical protein ACRE_026100 [Hapsidospora chrysogenum ATCC 11550]|uniref:Uncharacterized protein n=1 Tax=Hapsidospora chrysogenum (strain ATCC 11550 / CBS 779.69 / DSM 880 / IAM 14645 / JCM 23072 / IMI 49137) TaxID=857340 RepID=A0A086TB53_HAPC1|nr:hypothetical protein ACRE_026100 [Hapsidospora chrysogenum ATCC 11550]